MKDEQLDNIMKKHIRDKYSRIDIEQTVMNRIQEYEEKKSSRLIYWEYVFSGMLLFSGIISIFIIQYIFNINIYSGFNRWFQIYISAVRWISTIIFALIILSIILSVSFTSVFKIDKKILRKHI